MDAPLIERQNSRLLLGAKLLLKYSAIYIWGQTEHKGEQVDCFIPGIVCAMTKIEVTLLKQRLAMIEHLGNSIGRGFTR